ncbi:MAG: uroporphyrinogen-III C-methyltransferase [Elusimicrobia bacterium RIFCSPLOWO2_02_FULL_39_32]|nr:MAG: uroporphyrinogen-III C-methyltransferase [Elusimicrobia bacterium GWA2_38_7]OGR80082.1 MAG: uroporphyrinogen-III C-methyltransferase [Elusimicrobia bacterium RIFCSPHIGHO2_02_FULL_39_36]OGR91123.1 MAG: uroporphyrinogen-III C-methyltransferase [Elusimicrobia bacterium RIFCSPLOWO2_02_FULL_39_32]OGS00090.1 MAG: uroporphyrinogen-III C-methyltransferase [Elusimicrobia bacterium RIFCSPLOWO2_12_FULL_39_28]
MIKTYRRNDREEGMVYLIGGGPGDPELLTLKGKHCLEKTDVVIYDALINLELLEHCPKNAERIFVGKRRHRHAYEQKEINQLLLRHAKMGKVVCRLKGGDPYLFGRGGEEAELLSKNKISFEVVPGISSIIAVPAYAGIPLTHRRYASFVTIATGHQKDGEEKSKNNEDSEWCHYSSKKSLVILMGFARLKAIVQRLIHFGWPKNSHIALISSGTLPNQFTLTGTLQDIVPKVEKFKDSLSSPAMIVVGNVVKLNKIIKPKTFIRKQET